VPITAMLFGDELQTQLNHISASNKISSTANNSMFSNKRQYANLKNRLSSGGLFLGKMPPGNQSQTYRKPAQYNSCKKQPTDQTNDRK